LLDCVYPSYLQAGVPTNEIKMQIKPIKPPIGVTEASGVARKGNDLLIRERWCAGRILQL
jgi:hypothetical protein